MFRAIALFTLLITPASAGTLFDENGNKIEVCKGSTCSPGNGGGTPPAPNPGTVVTVNQDGTVKLSSSNAATSSSTSHGGTAYGGAGGKGGSAASTSQGGNATSQGGNASAVINNPGSIRYSGSHTVRSVGNPPDISANPTAPCRVAVGVSGGVLGGAIGISGSVLDEGCDARADATMLWALGLEGAAYARLCQKPEMARAMGGLCTMQEQPPAPVSSAFKH